MKHIYLLLIFTLLVSCEENLISEPTSSTNSEIMVEESIDEQELSTETQNEIDKEIINLLEEAIQENIPVEETNLEETTKIEEVEEVVVSTKIQKKTQKTGSSGY